MRDESLLTAIANGREHLLSTMLELRDPELAPPEEARQFLAGFLHLVESAAAGDMHPRDEYLGVVIPGVRASGFPLDATLDALIRAALALTAALDPRYHRWVAGFCGDYTRLLVRAWDEAGAP